MRLLHSASWNKEQWQSMILEDKQMRFVDILLGILSGLLRLVLSCGDILLWPDDAVKLHLRQEASRPRERRSIKDICHRVFIYLIVIVLFLLLVWK
jgi:hypothetical protein